MIDGRQIKIRQISSTPKAWLCLQGTILSFRERSPSHELAMDVPVELISVTEQKQFKATFLIAALLSLLAGLSMGVLCHWFCELKHASDAVVNTCMITIFAAAGLLFLALLVRFIVRDKTISLCLTSDDDNDENDDGHAITFWLEKRKSDEIGELITEIEERKELVAETIDHPMGFAVGETVVHPWPRTFGLIILFALPAMVTQIRWLLVLCAIPIIQRVRAMFHDLQCPTAFRKAFRLALKKKYAEAQDMALRIIDDDPEYLQAKLFLIELLMRQEDFSGAETVLADIQDRLDTDTLQSIQKDIILRKRITARKKSPA